MRTSIVLDTSAASQIMQRRIEALEALAQESADRVIFCAPVAAEIVFGLERLETGSRRRVLLSESFVDLRQACRWVDWTVDAADRFGRIKAELQRIGQPIDDMDLIIASIALSADARLATANSKHFNRIPGLEVVDWDWTRK